MDRNFPASLAVLMPVRDDWVSAEELVRRLDRAFACLPYTIEVLMVDDGSVQRCAETIPNLDLTSIREVRVLRLRRNLGHQRAIAVGLAFLFDTAKYDTVLVMDSDGEDTPQGAVDLLNAYAMREPKAVFAARSRRSESFTFRVFYHLYRVLHKGLTGISVRVGNFSVLPFEYLSTLTAMSELWNHYAAAVFRSKLPFTTIPIARGTRIAGKPKMNFVALVSHGLSAISVFGDIVGTRLLIGSLVCSLIAAIGIVVAVGIRIFTDRAIPGWATYATGVLAIIAIQFMTIAASFTFFVLSSRGEFGFVPLRDYSIFVQEVQSVYCHARV